MGPTACGLVAGLIDWIEGRHSDHGRPRCPTETVVETLRFFLRRRAMAGIAGHRGSGMRRDAAAAPHGMEQHGAAAPGACRARAHGALGAGSGRRRVGCCHRQLQCAGQARRRTDRSKPLRSAVPKPPMPRPSKSHTRSCLPCPKYRHSIQDLTGPSHTNLKVHRIMSVFWQRRLTEARIHLTDLCERLGFLLCRC